MRDNDNIKWELRPKLNELAVNGPRYSHRKEGYSLCMVKNPDELEHFYCP